MPCRDFSKCECVDAMETSKHIFIELSSLCNFNCKYCVYQYMTRPKSFMDLGILQKALHDLSKFDVEYIMFSAMGEPTLHPNFAQACKMVKESGYRLVLTTNGATLDDSMLSLPIDELFISLMTPSIDTFKLRDSSLDYDVYLRQVCDFAQKSPWTASIYLLKENLRLYPEMKGLVTEENKLEILGKIGKMINPSFEIQSFDTFYLWVTPKVNLYLRNLDPWMVVSHREGFKKADSIPWCPYYTHHINILHNGDVTFCCMDYDGEGVLGNIRHESIFDIYYRKPIGINLSRYDFCRKCRGDIICP